MFYSENAVKLLALKECGYLRTNAQFWREFSNHIIIDDYIQQHAEINQKIAQLKEEFDANDNSEYGIICVFDDEFPCINPKAKESEKPYVLFYRGDKTLLENLNNNVAVIGLIDPTNKIEERERKIVGKIISNNLVIVSGLAKGCDEIAHRVCVENKAKTIAILPTSLAKIAPASNRALAEEIVETGGLLITEYYKEATSRNEAVGRYIERDRLQALFSKAIIMIASYRQGDGDSGSRHAMNYAESYGIKRYIMYNEDIDGGDRRFGLSKQLKSSFGVNVLSPSSIDEIKAINNPSLEQKATSTPVQMKFI